MEDRTKIIEDLSVEEREEILIDIARTLEGNAREALVEGNQQFAALSTNIAEAIRVNADELARDDPEQAEELLQQAVAIISQFNATHPYRLISTAVH
ncbi:MULTISPECIES: hypothetical protein [unclassified Rhizobium]|uniref:hypothetical protein n=1 Tax=unclassified Rhizobium TaxID=2613769 RepID=UPI00064649C0|nr:MULTISPECIES: hypothetical protein [unclassified Rhizobium]MBN8950785.1 hypothetical protein [Rhizobium tropici]OJY66315.1 MAG: hypothetical protein BGP09_30710 [Rhizobium sp. 60-20]RKD69114.1 hypothetical protein BJ928_104253 [Rhizobium sp. WW_1]